MEATEKVDIRPLKLFAMEKLPDCTLKEVLLIEDDKLIVQNFMAKLPIWLKLCRLLQGREKSDRPVGRITKWVDE